MAKWKSQQYYTVQLQNVIYSQITLTEDVNLGLQPHEYWGGRHDVSFNNGRINGTITSLTEHVLPLLVRLKNGAMVACLPLQSVADFENETGLQWRDGLSLATMISKARTAYGLR